VFHRWSGTLPVIAVYRHSFPDDPAGCLARGDSAGLVHYLAIVGVVLGQDPISNPLAVIVVLRCYVELARSSGLIAWGSA
jgi:hypothetical protein